MTPQNLADSLGQHLALCFMDVCPLDMHHHLYKVRDFAEARPMALGLTMRALTDASETLACSGLLAVMGQAFFWRLST